MADTSIKTVSPSVTPKTVNSQSTITFIVVLTSHYLATGDVITFNVPSPGSFVTSGGTCSSTTTSVTVSSCNVQSNSIAATITVSNSLIQTFVIKYNLFVNPYSTTGLSTISVTLVDSTGTAKESLSNVQLTGLTAATMTVTPTIVSNNDIIGATGSTVTITFTTVNQLLTTGQVILTFPYWNPGSTSSKYSYITTTTPTCLGILVLQTTLTCTFSSDSNKLTLTNILTSNQVGGVQMKFSVNNVLNPYSGVPRTGFTLQTADSVSGAIDQSTALSFMVSTMTTLTSAFIDHTDGVTTVNELSAISVYFQLNFPVDANCRWRIDFPSDMILTSALSNVDGADIFSSTVSLTTENVASNYIEADGCATYQDGSSSSPNVAYLVLYDLLNKGWVQNTNTFTFKLYAMSGSTYYNIGQLLTGIYLTTSQLSAGIISTYTITAITSSYVQDTTTYQLTIKPTHAIPTSSTLTVQFPSSITLTSGTCTLSSTTNGMSSSPGSCTVTSNTLTITNPFGSSGSFSNSGTAFSFILSPGGTNPISSTDAGSFIVSTFYTSSSTNYPIDAFTFTNKFTPTYTTLTSSIQSTSSTTTCTSGVSYYLSITNLKKIPAGGIINVVFPTQVSLSGTSLTGCKITLSGGTQTTLSGCSVTATSPVTIKIQNAFSTLYTTIGSAMILQMDGITNPSTTSTSSTFTVSTADSSNNLIEVISNGITVTMTGVNSLNAFTASLTNLVNGNTAGKLLISVTVNCAASSGAILKFTVPSEIVLPTTITCTAGSLVASVTSCTQSSNAVTAAFTFSSGSVTSGNTFSFYITTLTNPGSTKPTSAFSSITISDSSSNIISTYTGTSVTVQTTTPATATGSLSQQTSVASGSGDYTIYYTSINAVPSGAAFQISYPNTITVPSTLTHCYIVVSGINYPMTCSVNSATNTMYLSGFTGAISAGNLFAITLGYITNPSSTTTSTASMGVTSFTDSTYSYTIDNVASNLIPGLACNYPCATCSSSSKSVCLTCDLTDASGNIYLQSGTCTTSCSTGYYADTNKQCQACMTQCKTCTAATTCATCNSAGTYPILYSSNCLSACPTGYYLSSGSCLACSSTCQTCLTTASTCVTCNTAGTYPNFYSSSCVTTCPTGTTAIAYVCTTCTSPCLTCSTLATQCTSCQAGYYLYGNTCVTVCPTTTVYQSSSNQCVNCNTGCAICDATSTTTCLQCSTGYYIYSGSCYTTCPSSLVVDSTGKTCVTATPSSCASGYYLTASTCVACSSTCATCVTSASNCLTCVTSSGSNQYFYSSSCLSACPSGFVSVSFTCVACASPCSTCSTSQTLCSTCISSYYLYLGQCLSACPTGTALISSTSSCSNCNANCNICTASSTAVCTQCATGYYLSSNNCYSTCPNGLVADSTKTTCITNVNTTYSNTTTTSSNLNPCGIGNYQTTTGACYGCTYPCYTCAYASTNCTACDTRAIYPYFYSNTCLKKCPTGYSDSNYSCVKESCVTPCANCSTSPSTCSQCVQGYFQYKTSCVNSCPIGTTISNTQSQCLACNTYCDACSSTNTGICLQCKSGYYLYYYNCFRACPYGFSPDNATQTQCVNSTKAIIIINNNTNPNYTFDGNASNCSNCTDKPYLFFPVASSQAILGGVAVGSHFKDPTSMMHSNMLGLWGPLEFVSYGGQAYMAYVQEVKKQSQYDFVHKINETQYRRLDETASSKSSGGLGSLVFYGSLLSMAMLIITNLVWAFVHWVLINKDEGYKDYRTRHCGTPYCLAIFGCLCSFKLGKFHYSRFYGQDKFSMQYGKHERIHSILNVLTIVNMVLTLAPIVFVDIYGIVKYGWGNQFYITMIETFVLALSVIVISVFEFRASKKMQPQEDYKQIADQSSFQEDVLMRKIEESIKRGLGGLGIDDFIGKLKKEKGMNDDEERKLKGLGKSNSMIDLNRNNEQDDRRVNTDPLDHKNKQKYDSRPNPWPRIFGDDGCPNNCYAEKGRLPKRIVKPENQRTKVVQTGDRVMTGEEFDKDFERRLKELEGKIDTRQDERIYGKATIDQTEDEELTIKKRKKNRESKMRGRKDKYYEQVDHEDQSFAEDNTNKYAEDNEQEENEDLEMLDKIEEESHNTDDEATLQNQHEDPQQLEENNLKLLEDHQKLEQQIIEESVNEDEQNMNQYFNQQENIIGDEAFNQEEEERKLRELEEEKEREREELERQRQIQIIQEQIRLQEEIATAQKLEELRIMEEKMKQKKEELERQRKQKEEEEVKRKLEEELAAKHKAEQEQLEKEILRQQQLKLEQDRLDAQLAAAKELENQIAKEAEILGEPDSDSDDDMRIKNMTNPDLRKFNVNDILGDFDRDEKGNLVILQNQKGDLIDKDGNNVNQKGYLVDEKTGDVVEKERRKKVFDKKDLDERGELPPPFNIERFNFNPHDVRGYFDRDADGNEIIGNKTNDKGQLIDKQGRVVNKYGYLVDSKGNLVDKRGRIRLHHRQMMPDGNLPLLFNYKGKKYDIKDVIGHFDKDRNGNIIIRRDKDNKMVDKKGRKVNPKGYLIDEEGNVINKDGKIMFESCALSKDHEIPKLFPFLKFNIDDIKGDFEMDPLGNPMLKRNKSGYLVDNKGRMVNSKGYLLDQNGNIQNRRGYKVFGKFLMEDDGEVPKVFRTGLFRKDTVDSFNQLMSEIEDLEKQHEMGERGHHMKNNKYKGRPEDREADLINKRIEQIVEEDNDDDDQIMKELEELANIRDAEAAPSEGGNTSVDSMMEDTPSNYNIANQRFMEQEQMRERVRQQIQNKQYIMDEDNESEMNDLPGKKLKRRKKKKKNKKKAPVPKEPVIDENAIMMAKAYGGLTQAQMNKYYQDKKKKELALASQMGRPPINKNASISRVGSMQSRRFGANQDEDAKSDWDNNFQGENQTMLGRFRQTGDSGLGEAQTNRNKKQGQSVRRVGGGYAPPIQKNNLMSSTQNSFGGRDRGDGTISQQSKMQNTNRINNPQEDRERRLSQIANSVSGFYRENSLSDQSKLRSTHESNFASNMPQGLKNARNLPNTDQRQEEEQKIRPLNEDLKGQTNEGAGGMGSGGETYDADLDRIYGTAKGFADVSMLSDWEKDSVISGQSAFSQQLAGGVQKQKKVRGLESIYLQRLEPASKGRSTQIGQKKGKKGEDKAKFRVMHHKFHDEPEWHVDDGQRDELDSVLSDNYKAMERKFKEEFQQESSARGKRKQDYMEEEIKPNIFHGNFYQYKDKKRSEQIGGIDLGN